MKKKRIIIITSVSLIVAAIVGLIVVRIINKQRGFDLIRDTNYQVDFWIDNSLFDVQFVKPNKSAYPKQVELVPGKIFTGWDIPLDVIQGNATAKAMFETTENKVNCFALESVYCAASESVTMTMVLCGRINISSADFLVRFDKDILRLQNIQNIDPSIVVNQDDENGVVYCSMLLDQKVEGDIDCLQLQFSVTDQAANSIVSIEVEDAARMKSNEIVDAKTETVSGTIYVLKKR